jgi:ribonuclease Z
MKTLREMLMLGVMIALLPTAAHAQEIKVTLLGTGTPVPAMNRFGPSILIEAGGQKVLFDAGRGAMQRLAQLKVRWQDIDGVFLTHLHSDHVVGFPDLWLTGWHAEDDVEAGRSLADLGRTGQICSTAVCRDRT